MKRSFSPIIVCKSKIAKLYLLAKSQGALSQRDTAQAKKVAGVPVTDLLAFWLKIEDNKAGFLLAESQVALPERDTGNKDVGCENTTIKRSSRLLAENRR